MKTTALAILTLLALESSAWADSATIDLDVRAPGFDAATLRGRLSVDLGEPVVAPTETASVHLLVTESNGRYVVGITIGDRQVTRQIVLSADRAVAEETLELVLAAMMRTEGRYRTPEENVAPPPEPLPPPAPPPPPAIVSVVHPRVVVAAPPLVATERDAVVPVGVDFLPLVGVSSVTRARDTRNFSLGALGTLAHNIDGLGIDGIVGITTGTVRGVEIAGITSVVANDVDGAQIGGVVNVAGSVSGVQIGGVANVAAGDVDGAQIGGVVNVAAGHVRGVQLGLVNVASDSDAPIGLFNIIKNGGHHVDVWSQDTGAVMAGVQLGGKYTHAILGVGARPGPDGVRFVYGGGIGVHADVSERVGLDFDLLQHDFAAFRSPTAFVQLSQARVLFDIALVPRFRIFAAPRSTCSSRRTRRTRTRAPSARGASVARATRACRCGRALRSARACSSF